MLTARNNFLRPITFSGMRIYQLDAEQPQFRLARCWGAVGTQIIGLNQRDIKRHLVCFVPVRQPSVPTGFGAISRPIRCLQSNSRLCGGVPWSLIKSHDLGISFSCTGVLIVESNNNASQHSNNPTFQHIF